MILLDTDILTHYWAGHARVVAKVQAAKEMPVTSVVSRIEVLQGRFDSILKAADRDQLLQAHERLKLVETELAKFTIVPIDAIVADEFERLVPNKKLKKIGRADLLIACIALAHRAPLVTRNLRDFQLVPGLKIENWAD
jgi:tRNA(fMet)-specific endonuclease VapC